MKIRNEQVIAVRDWDKMVEKTYGRPYSFQQQDGCKDRGIWRFSVPSEEVNDITRETVPEIVNHEIMGVNFAAWLARDPKKPLLDGKDDSFGIKLWWKRNFYPDMQMIANDLHAKGLLPAGEYTIDINW